MMQLCSGIDYLAAAGIAAGLFGAVLAILVLSKDVARAKRKAEDAALQLAGAQHRLAQAQAQVLALTPNDPITGLLVRDELRRRFQSALAMARRSDSVAGVVLINLPGFPAVAAAHGPEVADRVLAALGQRLRNVTREMDALARIDEHEFAVLLPRMAGADDLATITRKLRAELERPYTLTGMPGAIRVQLCFGHASYPRDGADWTTIMTAGDERLARARILVGA